MTIALGCIADDFTGATDLANTLVGRGMPTIQLIGVPEADIDIGDAQAVVIALKTRTIPAAEAVTQSRAALDWLDARGTRQFFFKYCSTFDSTDDGNIGPVADALMEALAADFTLFCPAFPTNGRTIHQGHLFVGDQLLSESGMKDHPLTPMTDANLVRVLGRQTSRSVGLVPLATVREGPKAIRSAFATLRGAGIPYAITDATADDDLVAIGRAAADLRLVTGGSGIALGLPDNFRSKGALGEPVAPGLPHATGGEAILAGSCSVRTREQIAAWQKAGHPAYAIRPEAVMAGEPVVAAALAWAEPYLGYEPVLIYSSADPADVTEAQAKYGRAEVGTAIENTLGDIANSLTNKGVDRLVAAGGETSGAIVLALNIFALKICREIDPGVPWTEAALGIGPGNRGKSIALALKSGNFGAIDFFERALEMLR